MAGWYLSGNRVESHFILIYSGISKKSSNAGVIQFVFLTKVSK